VPFQSDEIAWAAGYYEGEGSCHQRYGYFRTSKGELRRRRSPQYVLQIGSTDKEPLDRFRKAFGFGTVTGPYQDGVWQPHWKYAISGFEKVQAVLAAIWPWLSPRRQKQARRALTGGDGHPVQV
jgi:hypothetical protein